MFRDFPYVNHRCIVWRASYTPINLKREHSLPKCARMLASYLNFPERKKFFTLRHLFDFWVTSCILNYFIILSHFIIFCSNSSNNINYSVINLKFVLCMILIKTNINYPKSISSDVLLKLKISNLMRICFPINPFWEKFWKNYGPDDSSLFYWIFLILPLPFNHL